MPTSLHLSELSSPFSISSYLSLSLSIACLSVSLFLSSVLSLNLSRININTVRCTSFPWLATTNCLATINKSDLLCNSVLNIWTAIRSKQLFRTFLHKWSQLDNYSLVLILTPTLSDSLKCPHIREDSIITLDHL